jgi:hypothetical protein
MSSGCCQLAHSHPSNRLPRMNGADVVVTYKLGDAALGEAVVRRKLALADQLDGRLGLVLEDLHTTVRHWVLGEAV